MRRIDQDPRDYRAKPIKGEPVFVPGAGRRVAIWTAILAFMLGLSVLVQLVLGGPAEWFATTVTNWIFN